MRLAIIAAKMKRSPGELLPTPSERELGDVAELMKALAELDVSEKDAMSVSLGSVLLDEQLGGPPAAGLGWGILLLLAAVAFPGSALLCSAPKRVCQGAGGEKGGEMGR